MDVSISLCTIAQSGGRSSRSYSGTASSTNTEYTCGANRYALVFINVTSFAAAGNTVATAKNITNSYSQVTAVPVASGGGVTVVSTGVICLEPGESFSTSHVGTHAGNNSSFSWTIVEFFRNSERI